MNFNNLENYAELLNDTQDTTAELYELTEGDLDELFSDLEEATQSNDWEERCEAAEEFNAMAWLAEQDLTDAEFDQLMDAC